MTWNSSPLRLNHREEISSPYALAQWTGHLSLTKTPCRSPAGLPCEPCGTQKKKKKANSTVVQVVQLEGPLERLSDCRTVPYLRFFLVRNEEVVGSNPISSTIFH